MLLRYEWPCITLTKDGNFYQTNVDANGVNHGGSKMVQNKQ